MLTDEELLRYSRQIMLPELDIAGQEQLRKASVLVVGLGGLGSPVAMYLAAAGVGKLVLVDHDQVDLSNLQRQISHATDRVGVDKVASAAVMLKQLNPGCEVETVTARLTEDNADSLVSSCDVVVDCSDNFAVRFLLNRVSVACNKPLVSGAAIRMDGQVSVYDPRVPDSPCYRCLFEETGEEDLRCATNGVLAPLVGIVGSIQATEAIKVITHVGEPLVGRLLIIDAINMNFRSVKVKPNPDCPVCSGQ
ncbi:MAG: molybdopterin-synthase adenylyltransferase MoeB [Pseudomonadales bacterium]|nr:molybdopterin-synthase adenylyltransferase MoeB [Pseudomonadales bacterium]RLU03414.1 MAG: molybdopterin-synthase adenylyltransferase MoeB [Ketobacter sp.]